jgi:hypothetical protein
MVGYPMYGYPILLTPIVAQFNLGCLYRDGECVEQGPLSVWDLALVLQQARASAPPLLRLALLARLTLRESGRQEDWPEHRHGCQQLAMVGNSNRERCIYRWNTAQQHTSQRMRSRCARERGHPSLRCFTGRQPQ